MYPEANIHVLTCHFNFMCAHTQNATLLISVYDLMLQMAQLI